MELTRRTKPVSLVPLASFAALSIAAMPARAQVRAALEAGASYVEYSGFLPSAAFSLTPSLAVAKSRVRFLAQGTWLTFESGNNSVQGVAIGSLLFPPSPRMLPEVEVEVGASRYEGFAHFSHLLGRARLRFPATGGPTAWVATTVGTSASDVAEALFQAGAGLHFERRTFSAALSGTATFIGNAEYADFDLRVASGRAGGLMAAIALSGRAGTHDLDPGPHVEASVMIPMTSHVGVVAAGGGYPADFVRGNIGGRYVMAGFRIMTTLVPRRLPSMLPERSGTSDEPSVGASLVDVRRRRDACTFVLRAEAASRLELMADFTDWQPIEAQRAGPGLWRLTLPCLPGRHRLNVRVDGGAWGIPAGVTSIPDEFLGEVGTIIIP